ncbi:M4 family metallopeptidase [Spongiactinospora sp. TRM90649]|uniref:M4 family metallopeptidase n=1 Tax=Spongiactinospora sp. TRM90649 TaxID=3031114 RepID=UPI0023F95D3A|nr:M4 family metallopeptidase [Spongiactinospora sp. TRM90649]MDF5756070.1 M4 family metallopeptidase [Spongiactinospora sp. TRM90649]
MLTGTAMVVALVSPPGAAAGSQAGGAALAAPAVRAAGSVALTAPGPESAAASPTDAPPDEKARARALDLARRTLSGGGHAAVERSPDDRFGEPKIVFGAGGLQFLSFPRTHHGLPVYGGDVNFMISRDGRNLLYTTSAQRAEIDVPVTPAIDKAQASSIARAGTGSGGGVAVRSARLVVHATGATPRTAWEVTAEGMSRDGVPTRPHVFVDAANGKVLDTWDDVRRGVGHSNYNGDPVDIDTTATDSAYTLTDPLRPGIRCGPVSGTFDGADDDWGNGSGTDPETACVDTLFGVQHEWDMLSAWTGRNGIDGKGNGFPARVGFDMPNATWSGTEVNLGRNVAGTKQTTSLDVVGHEYGHAVFQTSGSGGAGGGGWTAALNESTGDILGAMLEHYVGHPDTLDEPDYLVGEEVDLLGTGPVRNMYDPSQINGHVSCYNPNPPAPDPHAGAGLLNHWFYLLAEGSDPTNGNPASPTCNRSRVDGIGIQKAGRIFVNALQLKTAGWGPGEARIATVLLAYTLFPRSCKEAGAVKAAWEALWVSSQPGEPIYECWPFEMRLESSQGTTPAGGSVQVWIETLAWLDPPAVITMSSGRLPDGISLFIFPPQITAGERALAQIWTRPDFRPGRYPIEFIGTVGSFYQIARFELTVTEPPPKLEITVDPATLTLDRDLKGTATLSTKSMSGPPATYRLTVENGAPDGLTAALDPTEITPGQGSTVTVAATRATPPGTYPLTFWAIGPAMSASATLTVKVPAPEPAPKAWRPWTRYKAGDLVTYDGHRYRCRQTHTSQPGRTPPRTPALWSLLP